MKSLNAAMQSIRGLALWSNGEDFYLYDPNPLFAYINSKNQYSSVSLQREYGTPPRLPNSKGNPVDLDISHLDEEIKKVVTEVCGYAMIRTEYSGNYYTVSLSSARKGYGPAIYIIAIQSLSAGLASDQTGNTSAKAQQVWDTFYENSPENGIRAIPRDGIACTFCNYGHIPCGNCDEGYVDCGECNGTGKVTCETCNGREIITCPNCNGNVDNEDCENCDGEGVISCPDCGGSGEEDCGECEDGQVECEDCDGRGERVCPECDGYYDTGGVSPSDGCRYYYVADTKIINTDEAELLHKRVCDFLKTCGISNPDSIFYYACSKSFQRWQ